MKRTQSQRGQLLERPVVLFVTNCLASYRYVMLDAWTTTGCVTTDVAVTTWHTDTAQDWGDTRVSGQGWHVIPSVNMGLSKEEEL